MEPDPGRMKRGARARPVKMHEGARRHLWTHLHPSVAAAGCRASNFDCGGSWERRRQAVSSVPSVDERGRGCAWLSLAFQSHSGWAEWPP